MMAQQSDNSAPSDSAAKRAAPSLADAAETAGTRWNAVAATALSTAWVDATAEQRTTAADDVLFAAAVTAVEAFNGYPDDEVFAIAIDIVTRAACYGPPDALQATFFGAVLSFMDDCESAAAASKVTAGQRMLHAVYRAHAVLRLPIRQLLLSAAATTLNRSFTTGGDALSDHLYVSSLLKMLVPLVDGFASVPRAELDAIALQSLIPMCGINDQQAFQAYGGVVVALLSSLLRLVPDDDVTEQTVAVASRLTSLWLQTKPSVCCNVLRALGGIADLIGSEAFLQLQPKLMITIASAVASDFTSLSTAALAAVRGSMMTLIAHDAERCLAALAPGMCRHGKLHWDATVVDQTAQLWRSLSDTFGGAWRTAAAVALHGEDAMAEYEARLLGAYDLHEAEAQELAVAKKERLATAATAMRGTPLMHRRFVFGRELGSGAYSSVVFAKFIEQQVPQQLWIDVAVKAIAKVAVGCDIDAHRNAIQTEIALHTQLTEVGMPGVVKLLGVFEDALTQYMVQECCPHGDLHTLTIAAEAARSQRQFVPWTKTLLLEVATALHGCHRSGIMMGDLKPENVLVGIDGHVRLCDFGACMKLVDVATTTAFAGTLHYSAPELLRGDAPVDGVAADWWAFAITAGHIIHGALLVDGADDIVRRRLLALPDALFDASVAELPAFVAALLCLDPAARGGYDAVANDPYFQGVAPFADDMPPPPRTVRAMGQQSVRQSGRKQSMMWQQHRVTGATLDAMTNDAASCPAEPPGTAAQFHVYVATVRKQRNAEPTPGIGAGGYMTVMPRRR
jgi:hypothetical protein